MDSILHAFLNIKLSFNMLPRTVARMRIYKRRRNWRRVLCNLRRAASARGESHVAWRGCGKSWRDSVSICGHQIDLQRDAAHCCTYAHLQTAAHLTQCAVLFNALGKRARRVAFRAARWWKKLARYYGYLCASKRTSTKYSASRCAHTPRQNLRSAPRALMCAAAINIGAAASRSW